MNGVMKVGQVDSDLSNAWVRFGPVAGLIGVAAYFVATTGILPERVTLVLVFSMGPLLSAVFMGFYHFLREHKNSPALQTATVFGVIAGTL